jgi:hypothetical protein
VEEHGNTNKRKHAPRAKTKKKVRIRRAPYFDAIQHHLQTGQSKNRTDVPQLPIHIHVKPKVPKSFKKKHSHINRHGPWRHISPFDSVFFSSKNTSPKNTPKSTMTRTIDNTTRTLFNENALKQDNTFKIMYFKVHALGANARAILAASGAKWECVFPKVPSLPIISSLT